MVDKVPSFFLRIVHETPREDISLGPKVLHTLLCHLQICQEIHQASSCQNKILEHLKAEFHSTLRRTCRSFSNIAILFPFSFCYHGQGSSCALAWTPVYLLDFARAFQVPSQKLDLWRIPCAAFWVTHRLLCFVSTVIAAEQVSIFFRSLLIAGPWECTLRVHWSSSGILLFVSSL